MSVDPKLIPGLIEALENAKSSGMAPDYILMHPDTLRKHLIGYGYTEEQADAFMKQLEEDDEMMK